MASEEEYDSVEWEREEVLVLGDEIQRIRQALAADSDDEFESDGDSSSEAEEDGNEDFIESTSYKLTRLQTPSQLNTPLEISSPTPASPESDVFIPSRVQNSDSLSPSADAVQMTVEEPADAVPMTVEEPANAVQMTVVESTDAVPMTVVNPLSSSADVVQVTAEEPEAENARYNIHRISDLMSPIANAAQMTVEEPAADNATYHIHANSSNEEEDNEQVAWYQYQPNEAVDSDDDQFDVSSINSREALLLSLQRNKEYQAIIIDELKQIELFLVENRERQLGLLQVTLSHEEETNHPLPSLIKFSKPYFRDAEGDGPPDNEDALHNRWHANILAYDTPSKQWNGNEKKRLAEGVRKQNLKRKLEPLMKRLCKLGSTEADDMEASRLRQKIKQKIKETKDLLHNNPKALEQDLMDIDWDDVATNFLPRRSAIECQLQWSHFGHPRVNLKPWTKYEDKLLLQHAGNGNSWNLVAQNLQTNRTPIQCFQRYQRSLNKNILRSKWTPEEDKQLIELVKMFGEGNWQKVANYMEGRTGEQIMHRYMKACKPTKKGKWSQEENECLLKAVEQMKVLNWEKVSDLVQGRTGTQCRERYVNVLSPSLVKGTFSKKEDKMLLEGIQQYGEGNWSKIAKFLGTRTDNQCWRRWRVLRKEDYLHYTKNTLRKKREMPINFVNRKQYRPTLGPHDLDIEDIEIKLPKLGRPPVKKEPVKPDPAVNREEGVPNEDGSVNEGASKDDTPKAPKKKQPSATKKKQSSSTKKKQPSATSGVTSGETSGMTPAKGKRKTRSKRVTAGNEKKRDGGTSLGPAQGDEISTPIGGKRTSKDIPSEKRRMRKVSFSNDEDWEDGAVDMDVSVPEQRRSGRKKKPVTFEVNEESNDEADEDMVVNYSNKRRYSKEAVNGSAATSRPRLKRIKQERVDDGDPNAPRTASGQTGVKVDGQLSAFSLLLQAFQINVQAVLQNMNAKHQQPSQAPSAPQAQTANSDQQVGKDSPSVEQQPEDERSATTSSSTMAGVSTKAGVSRQNDTIPLDGSDGIPVVSDSSPGHTPQRKAGTPKTSLSEPETLQAESSGASLSAESTNQPAEEASGKVSSDANKDTTNNRRKGTPRKKIQKKFDMGSPSATKSRADSIDKVMLRQRIDCVIKKNDDILSKTTPINVGRPALPQPPLDPEHCKLMNDIHSVTITPTSESASKRPFIPPLPPCFATLSGLVRLLNAKEELQKRAKTLYRRKELTGSLRPSNGVTSTANTSESSLRPLNDTNTANTSETRLRPSHDATNTANTSETTSSRASKDDANTANTSETNLRPSNDDANTANTSETSLRPSNDDANTEASLQPSNDSNTITSNTSSLRPSNEDAVCVINDHQTTTTASATSLRASNDDTNTANTSETNLRASHDDTNTANTSETSLRPSNDDTNTANTSETSLRASNDDTNTANTSETTSLRASNVDTNTANTSETSLRASNEETVCVINNHQTATTASATSLQPSDKDTNTEKASETRQPVAQAGVVAVDNRSEKSTDHRRKPSVGEAVEIEDSNEDVRSKDPSEQESNSKSLERPSSTNTSSHIAVQPRISESQPLVTGVLASLPRPQRPIETDPYIKFCLYRNAPEYKLLAARFNSLFLWPMLVSKIPVKGRLSMPLFHVARPPPLPPHPSLPKMNKAPLPPSTINMAPLPSPNINKAPMPLPQKRKAPLPPAKISTTSSGNQTGSSVNRQVVQHRLAAERQAKSDSKNSRKAPSKGKGKKGTTSTSDKDAATSSKQQEHSTPLPMRSSKRAVKRISYASLLASSDEGEITDDECTIRLSETSDSDEEAVITTPRKRKRKTQPRKLADTSDGNANDEGTVDHLSDTSDSDKEPITSTPPKRKRIIQPRKLVEKSASNSKASNSQHPTPSVKPRPVSVSRTNTCNKFSLKEICKVFTRNKNSKRQKTGKKPSTS